MRILSLMLAVWAAGRLAAEPVRVAVATDEIPGPVKAMNGVNNGPIEHGRSPKLGNAADFAALEIPFVRTHDSSFCLAYGGERTIDVSAVFPDFPDELEGLGPGAKVTWKIITSADAKPLPDGSLLLPKAGESKRLTASVPVVWKVESIAEPANPWDSPNPRMKRVSSDLAAPADGACAFSVSFARR